MTTWHLDREGFVQHYLVSGPLAVPFSRPERDRNQLRYEAWLRSVIAEHAPVKDAEAFSASAKENSRLGLPWRFQGGRDTAFVNLSEFYATMQRVVFDAATALAVPRDMDVSAVLWSYAAVDVYCGGKRVGGIAAPVYKPIARQEITLPLKAGKNVVYLACETLGVRDTRSVAGLQILSGREEIGVTLPDEAMAEAAAPALEFVESARLLPDALVFSRPAPKDTVWAWFHEEPDYAKQGLPLQWHQAAGETRAALPPGETGLRLQTRAGGCVISRDLERTEQIRPRTLSPVPSYEENLRAIYRRIADVESLNRGGEFGFPIANMLARKYLGDDSRDDEKNMRDMLELIERRVDCADFLVCGLVRYLKNYPVDPRTAERVKHALTHFRYWMDQDGFDGMCFWSENHSLMFYAGAMQAGELYPDEYFPLANRTGKELRAWGRGKVLDWLDDVEAHGFEEFLSTVYTCVTFAALINVVNFVEGAIASGEI